MGDGLYIGRIWYTYPVNGISAGDFSGTVVGDSYIIKDGRIGAPIKPNTLRMNENIHNVLNKILGIGTRRHGTVRWASDQVAWAPDVAGGGLPPQRDRRLHGAGVLAPDQYHFPLHGRGGVGTFLGHVHVDLGTALRTLEGRCPARC